MNDKKTKKTQTQKKYIFQVHTMHTDNEARATKSVDSKTASPSKGNNLPHVKKEQTALQKQSSQSRGSKQSKQQTSNPFLASDVPKNTDAKKGTFAPGAQKKTVEKINQTPADIASSKKISKKKHGGTQKKMIYIIMIVFIILFLLGAVGFGVYMLKFNTQQISDDVIVADDTMDMPIEIEVDDTDNNINIDVDTEKIPGNIEVEGTESVEQLYATNLPNYFSIDVESTTTQQDIATELKTIAQNMQKQDMTGPISFIVTDQNSNPVSFHVFSMSAGMNIPQDILISLEEGFEIYAYNDGMKGVRFGFVIDAKDVETLHTAILASETNLPKLFDIVLNDLGTSATGIVFNDNSYETYPIRYYNLNEEESYSIDYTINNKSWIIGTTKNTLRAIIDSLKEAETSNIDRNL